MFRTRAELDTQLKDFLAELPKKDEPAYVFAFFDHRVAVGLIRDGGVTWQRT